MTNTRASLRRLAATSVGTGLSLILLFSLPALTPLEARAELTDLVHVTGTMDNGETVDTIGVLDGGFGYGKSQTCSERNKAIDEFMAANGLALAPLLGGVQAMAEILEWGETNPDLSPPCPKVVDGDFHIFYTTCSMTMFMGPQGSPVQMLRWTVPPLAPEAEMIVIDGNEGMRVQLKTSLEKLSGQVTAVGPATNPDGTIYTPGPGVVGPGLTTQEVQTPNLAGTTDTKATKVTPLKETKTYSLSNRNYEAQLHRFNYLGRPASFAGFSFTRVENEGWAYVSRDVPGLDVVQTFYANFVKYVVPAAGGAGTLLGGMVEQMAAIVDYGFPLQGSTTSTTSTTTMSSPSLSGPMGLASASSTDSYTITNVTAVGPVIHADLCAPIVVPEGFEVMDLGEALAGAGDALAGATGAGAGDIGAGLAEAMQNMTPEEQAAMQQAMSGGLGAMLGGLSGAAGGIAPAAAGAGGGMTPEQQAAMQQVGGMLGGLLGGAGAAAAAAAGGAAVPGVAAAPTTARPAGPSLSSALMTDNLTQSAQNMLGALGYDPGNTDGELSVATSIAISQFQAEQGLEVTGEVTPQLVGLLAARVDAL